ncbi:MAG: aquaporin [Actinomycetota bacterium]|nr:aquaporin [Actinomycetota bacterium]
MDVYSLQKRLMAEFLGTFFLVFVAVGAAVAGIAGDFDPTKDSLIPGSGVVGVALAFGFVLVMAVYAIGHISGCHINPAVTIAMMVGRKMPAKEGLSFMGAQVVGAIVGAALLKFLVEFGDVTDKTGALGSNAYDNGSINMVGALVLEILLTFVFVSVIMFVTDSHAVPGFAGIAIGLSLTAVHLVGIPLDGTSVNPARSIGPALFSGDSTAITQLWLFILAPLVGGVLAAVVWKFLTPDHLETTDISTD